MDQKPCPHQLAEGDERNPLSACNVQALNAQIIQLLAIRLRSTRLRTDQMVSGTRMKGAGI